MLGHTDEQLLKTHTDAWNKFWHISPSIEIENNKELASIIYASMFSVASSMQTSYATQAFFAPMSSDTGHVSSNTEQWVLPAINLLNSDWTRKFLNYRFRTLAVAMSAASETGYEGVQYSVKSAFTGIEIESDLYLLNKMHVSADISFGMRQYYAVTHDNEWLLREGCMVSREIAKFWASFVSLNEKTGFYDINDVTGPDKNHMGVNNDLYTNVAAGYALFFARLGNS